MPTTLNIILLALTIALVVAFAAYGQDRAFVGTPDPGYFLNLFCDDTNKTLTFQYREADCPNGITKLTHRTKPGDDTRTVTLTCT